MTLPEVDRPGIPSVSFTGDSIVGIFSPLSIYGKKRGERPFRNRERIDRT
jgi:hypothetical protein